MSESEVSDNYYARLGVARDASRKDIRDAYHQAARRLHPDVNPDPRAMDMFVKIQEAYDILSAPDRRQSYDESLPDKDEGQPIKLMTRFSRSSLARIAEPQLIYVLLEISPTPAAGTLKSPPLNVCLVLDRSTSMQGLRLDTLKSTARKVVRQLRPHDYLSMVTFSDHAEVLIPATRGSDYAKVEARIGLLQAGGSTEIFRGLKAGYFEVSRNFKPTFVNHLVLITDGRTYGDEDECLRLAEEARVKGLTISGLGIGTEWNDRFIDQLAAKTGGSSQYISSAEDIRIFLEEKLHGLGNTYAENVGLYFMQDPGVELKYAFRLEPETGPLSLDQPLMIGNVPLDGHLSILMEFLVTSVPSEASVVSLAQGDLQMAIPSQMIPVKRMPFVLNRDTSVTIDPEPPPQRIVKALSRLTLYRMQEQARQDMEKGDIEQATRRLQNLATHLLAGGERQLARTVLAEADRLQQGQKLSEQGEKRIKYGTRALLLPQHLEEAV